MVDRKDNKSLSHWALERIFNSGFFSVIVFDWGLFIKFKREKRICGMGGFENVWKCVFYESVTYLCGTLRICNLSKELWW